MDKLQKNQIFGLLQQFVADKQSISAAANSLRDVSRTTIDNILKQRWESISDEMWLNIGKQLGWHPIGQPWQLVHTYDFKLLVAFFEDAKAYANVYAICGPAGSGKTATASWYARTQKHVYHLVCAEYWNKKMFLSNILRQLGRENTGYSAAEMMEEIISVLLRQDHPLLILDEADKLNDSVLYFFITLYNSLKDQCGIVLMATDFLAKRINRGLKLNKKGYQEIYSRIGRRFIYLRGTNKKEIEKICQENGISDPEQIAEIYNEYEGDLRRVERAIHKFKRKNAQKYELATLQVDE